VVDFAKNENEMGIYELLEFLIKGPEVTLENDEGTGGQSGSPAEAALPQLLLA
jgi:hypothetical protein